jgi:hypothetical protein
MAAFGIKAIQPEDNEHILGFATARATADMSLLEIWNGPTSSDLVLTVDKAGQLQAANGTVLRPSYAFENAKTDGLYYIGTNNLGFAVNAVLMMETATYGLGIQNAYGLVVGHTGQLVTGDPSSPGTAITAEVQVAGTATADATAMITRHSADANAGGITISKSRNAALGSYTVVQDNDYLGHVAFAADDGTDTNTTVARISGRVDDSSPAGSDIGGELILETGSGGGANNLAAALTLSAAKLATFTGIVSTTDATEATNTTTASLKTAGGIAWVKDAYVGDDMFFTSGAVLDFNSADMTVTHSSNTLTVAGGTWATAALTASTGVFSGILKTDDATQATSTTDGSLQTDGGLSVVKNAVITTMTLATGSITDSSGAISFGNENLTTTGTLASGALTVTGAVLVNTNDGGALGASGTGWSDLFLASGAVVDFNAGDVTLTHSSNTLTVGGGTLATGALTSSTGVFSGILKTDDATDASSGTDGSLQTDGGLSVVKAAWIGTTVTADAYLASANDSGALGASGTGFADLFLASDAVINFNAGDVTITHSANVLTIGGGDTSLANGFGLVIGHTALVAVANSAPEVEILGTGEADSCLVVGRWTDGGDAGSIRFYKSRGGSIGALATVNSGDQLGEIHAFGDDGSDPNTKSSAIIFDTEGTVGAGQVPGIIKLQVAAAGTLADALTVASNKAVSFSCPNTVSGTGLMLTSNDTSVQEVMRDSSSARFKEDIEDARIDVNAVLEINAKAYNRKGARGRNLGFIVEDFHDAGFGDIIAYDKVGPAGFLEFGRGVTALHHAVLQSHNDRIETNEEKIVRLEAEVAELRAV